MYFSPLKQLPVASQTVNAFRGYNHNLRIADGEFYDMQNLTGDFYPILSPRKKRGIDSARNPGVWNPMRNNPQAMADMNGLCFLSDGTLYYNYRSGLYQSIGLDLNEELPKKLVKFGSYLIVMPDKKYFNTQDPEDFGSIEAKYAADSEATVFPYDLKNEKSFVIGAWSDTPPENPEDGTYWVDTSEKGNKLMQYSSAGSNWFQRRSYLKLSAVGIGTDFKEGDSVIISSPDFPSDLKEVLKNGAQILAIGENYIVIEAFPVQMENTGFSVERRMPLMDFVFEHKNRLWGCRYGFALNGEFVNEIYVSKLGDFKNWNSFQGISTDSYVASCGTDGPWTGAISAMGYPLFFKENYLHKVYGSYPAEYQLQVIPCRGVQEGCHKSLAVVNEVLFYKAKSGVVYYDGSLPESISDAFGGVQYSDAVAGALLDKYYISMADSKGIYHLFCFDTGKKLWHREDDTHVDEFCTAKNQLYFIEHEEPYVHLIDGSAGAGDETVEWYAETGVLGLWEEEHKHIKRITVRMSMEPGARVRFLAEYDSVGGWKPLASIAGNRLDSFSIPLRPRRCDHMRLRIEGEGDAKIYSYTIIREKGSDRG